MNSLVARDRYDLIPCSGPEHLWNQILENKMGHTFVVFDEGPLEVVGCSTCGCNTMVKMLGLCQPCLGKPSSHSQLNWWRRLTTGWHPHTKEWIGAGKALLPYVRLMSAKQAQLQLEADDDVEV